jgi:hypothetical protein
LGANESLWNRRRIDLRQALVRVDAVMGDLYRRAICALDGEPCVAALVIASHCIREIANNLPDVLGDVDGLPSHEDTSQHSQNLMTVWRKFEATLGSPERPTARDSPTRANASDRLVTIPAELLDAAGRVVHASTVATANSQQRRSALVRGTLTDGDHGSVRVVKQSLTFFMAYTHLRKSEPIPLPARADILLHLSRFEDSLLGRIGDFFIRYDEIRDLLGQANRRIADPEKR